MEYRDQILLLSATYCSATGLSETRVATIVHSQGLFFRRLRSGQTCTVDTYLKVKRWFDQHWPAGTAWPDGVDPPEALPRWSDNETTRTEDAA